jgi:tetratricopeptide (TPR) repeat protein
MKFPALLFALLLACGAAQAQHEQHSMGNKDEAVLVEGMGSLHHAVLTRNAEAQKFFDQGLSFVYAFNHDEAVRSFKRAADLDPDLAMAYWGVAYALGPNINLDVDPEREIAAYNAVARARSLASKASPQERDYIEALARRYTNDSAATPDTLHKLSADFSGAMGALSKKYPNDLDAAVLYAESLMDLHPWQLWKPDGTPADGTLEIVATLESVLKRDPNHVGAIHYYIHAVEASPHPERALAYAPRLKRLMPAAGHIVHMPAHIYERTGDYAAAAQSNEDAAAADRAYVKARGAQGVYPLMYYNHNLHFMAVAYSMEGHYADSMRAARQLEDNVGPHVQGMPMLGRFMQTSALLLVRFRRWDDILKLPPPDANPTDINLIRHFARGMALAATGKGAEAESERQVFLTVARTAPARMRHGADAMGDILRLAEKVLSARIALARQDRGAAIGLLRQAVEVQDSMAYDEPPAWPMPMRETLGATLLLDGQAVEAERVFRADLERNPRNGRSLFGLWKALEAQHKTREAKAAQREFEAAWKNADTQLRVEDL